MNVSFMEIFVVLGSSIFLWLLIEFVSYRSNKKKNRQNYKE